MKIAILGYGVVGQALGASLYSRGHEIVEYDPPKGKTPSLDGCDYAFICCPAENLASGRQNIRHVESCVKDVPAGITIFTRTTLLPGTAAILSERHKRPIIAMPEFLTERTASIDMEKLPLVVGGKGNFLTDKIIDDLCWLFPNPYKFVFMTNDEAEFAKYFHNCFGALKVTYFNFIADVCRQTKVSFEAVRAGVLASGHINETHTQVPGPDGQPGFGGKCFPKDLEAFAYQFRHPLLLDTLDANDVYRTSGDHKPGYIHGYEQGAADNY